MKNCIDKILTSWSILKAKFGCGGIVVLFVLLAVVVYIPGSLYVFLCKTDSPLVALSSSVHKGDTVSVVIQDFNFKNFTKVISPTDSTVLVTFNLFDNNIELIKDFKQLREDVERLKNGYQDEINLLLVKGSGWLAFWISIIAIVIGFIFVIQVYNRNKDIERVDKIGNRIEDKLDNQLKNINDAEKDLRVRIKSSEVISQIICLINVADLQFKPATPDKMKIIKFVIRNLSSTFDQYVSLIVENGKTSDDNLFDSALFTILKSLKLALLRIISSFTSYEHNYMLYLLIMEIDNACCNLMDSPNDFKCDSIIKIQKQFTALINNL